MTDRRNPDPGAAHPQTAASCEISFEDHRPATRVIEAVARASDTSPSGLTTPLYDTIDPDALDRLFGPVNSADRQSGGALGFTVGEWDVVVDWRDESVRVYEASED